MSPTVCIQCALKAFVEGKSAPLFDEPPEVHMQRLHPDPAATQRERRELERQAQELVLRELDSRG